MSATAAKSQTGSNSILDSVLSSAKKFTLAAALAMPKFDGSVSALCWAYNEELLMGSYLDRLHNLLHRSIVNFEIIVIDDCSIDKTPGIIADRMKRYPEIRYFRNERNLGIGPSFKRAIQSAAKEFLFWQTTDWSYDISLLRLHLEFLREFDVVMGARRATVLEADRFLRPVKGVMKLVNFKHLTRRSDTPFKAFVSVINYLVIRILFDLELSDYQNVALFRTSLIQSIKWESASSFVCPEALIKVYWRGARMTEVPISFRPRTAGHAKGVTIQTIVRAVSDIMRCWFKWQVRRRVERTRNGEIVRMIETEWDLGPYESASEIWPKT